MSDNNQQANDDVEVKSFTPGQKAYMFGFNKIDVGVFGTSEYKSALAKFGVVCVRVVQRTTIETEGDKPDQVIYTASVLDSKGEPLPGKDGQPVVLNIPDYEMFKNIDELVDLINEKLELTLTNVKTSLNNSVVDAKSAYKRASKIVVPDSSIVT